MAGLALHFTRARHLSRDGEHACSRQNQTSAAGDFLVTGWSGAGKSLIAHSIEAPLHATDLHTIMLDGDNIRDRRNNDLGFSAADLWKTFGASAA